MRTDVNAEPYSDSGYQMDDLIRIAELFRTDGRPESVTPAGNGHINDTYLVQTDARRYILQRINTHVFSSPAELMENIDAVTCFADSRLRIIPTLTGELYAEEYGQAWRMMPYIDNTFTCERVDDAALFGEIGRAFGKFINDLSDLPADSLHETIRGFHDTRKRFEQFRASSEKDICGRREKAADEIRFAYEHEELADLLNECAGRGEIPVRVTHNDTRINNVLIDCDSGKAVCVIDLDTVMPGLSVNDFGDAIRSGSVTGINDEKDTEQIRLDMDLYRSFADGFTAGCPHLTQREIELLPYGALIMTLECGLRYLTDYLEGDHYFRTDHPEHNLIKCRAQFRLVREMEKHWDEMVQITQAYI